MNRVRSSLFCLLTITCPFVHAGWVDDWYDAANTVAPPGTYEGANRNYVYGGNFKLRMNTAVDHPISVSLPKLSAGCGGIDGFLGGMTFLDSDYLVEKAENIIQAAPALAFNLALAWMSQQLEEEMVKLEAATSYLNNIQIDECAMSKKAVVAVKDGRSQEVLGDMWTEMAGDESITQSMDRSWQEYQERKRANNNEATNDMRSVVQGCPALFRQVFQPGMLLDNAGQELGYDSEHMDLIRGFVGDVFIDPQTFNGGPATTVPTQTYVPPCVENDSSDIDALVDGQIFRRTVTPAGGECIPDSNLSVRTFAQQRLQSIADAIVNNTALSDDDQRFIQLNQNLAIGSFLRTAAVQGNLPQIVASLSDVTAYSMVNMMLSDALYVTNEVLLQVQRASEVSTDASGNGAQKCDTRLYEKSIGEVLRMNKQASNNRRLFARSYSVVLQQLQSSLELLEFGAKQDQTIQQKTVVNSKAAR